MPTVRFVSFAFATVALACGCDRQRGPERLPTVPVRGVVTVDGKPASKLTVRLHSRETPQGEVEIYAANPQSMTAEDGTFSVSTYEHGDGVAAGTYAITFEWLTFNFLQNSYGRPDKLKGKYADPETTPFEITVTGEEDDPVELTTYELET